jgi:pilus assembly protein CpaB
MANRQTLIALGVAVVLGLLAVFLANSFLSGRERKAYEGGTTKVAVAAAPLAFGTDITPEKIRFVDYPNTSIPPGAFTNAAQLLPPGKKRVALLPIAVNEPILPNKISREGEGASMSSLLPDGMRATTVRINDVSGVAGFIQPNDSVDVLITRTAPDGQEITDVLLQNIHVLAMGRQQKDANGAPIPAHTATLEVAPIDAQKLVLGEAAGALSLVLRKPGEPSNPVVETVSINDLRYNMYGGARYPAPAVVGGFGGLAGAVNGAATRSAATIASASRSRPVRRAATKARPVPPVDKSKQIEVYRGTKSDQIKVGG